MIGCASSDDGVISACNYSFLGMEPARHRTLEQLFEEALVLSSEQRRSLVEEVREDDQALGDDLRRLLVVHDEAPRYSERLSAMLWTHDQPAQSEAPRAPYESDMIGRVVSHYRILDEIGRGGMGTVYRAEDIRLGRQVALKFLPPEWGRDAGSKQRFIREAQSASGLDHPNICTVFEIDETEDGALFIAMAYYTGDTLLERIGRGPLPEDVALDIAIQVARGLRHAHENGIVHRDLKPANLILAEDGTVKIVDFGLAKTADSNLTKSGIRVGTLAYMSPEQARGDVVDARTDIWSLGVVLYEMLVGRGPFRAAYELAILYCILHEEPEPLSVARPGISPLLAEIVERALTKDRDGRYKDGSDMLAALVSVQGRGAPMRTAITQQKSIAVLPFTDISPGQDNEHFSDGMTEEVISDLSVIRELRVISRTSAMMLKGTKKDIRTIGRDLNVHYILEGSVRKSGNNLRITAQLIDSTNDSHLWGGKYSGTLDDVFDIQETVSRSIVNALRIELTRSEDLQLSRRPIEDVRAYECYIRARQEVWRWSTDALDRAQQYLQQGLTLIGPNALLYGGLGYVHWQYANLGSEGGQHLKKAESYVDQLLQLDPNSSHGYRLQGLVEVARMNMVEGMRKLITSYELDPNQPDTLSWLAMLYGYIGQPEQGFPLTERLLAIDPLNPFNYGVPGWLHFVRGDFEEALQAYRRMFDMEPENPGHRYLLAQALVYNGHHKQAFDIIDALAADSPDHLFTRMCVFFKHALQGDRDAALASMDESMEKIGDQNYAWFMSTGFAQIGETGKALDCLERSIHAGFVNYPFLSHIDPLLSPIRDSNRFRALMVELKSQWQRFENIR